MIKADFYRQDGPRGSGQKAPVDTEIEEFLRRELSAMTPEWSIEGEELPYQKGSDPAYCWVLDPQDGTSAFLGGFRGSSVSIGLLENHVPVLGVVRAPLYPNDQGDTISGARGVGLFRNGKRLNAEVPSHPLCAQDIVAVSQDADQKIEYNLHTLSPARYLAMPSVAYRLALAAAGEVRLGMSLAPLRTLDVAAGHALLLLSGRELQQLGQPGDPTIRYETQSGMHGIIGGDAQAIAALTPWKWESFGPKQRQILLSPSHRLRASGSPLERAQGCLLGQVAGDSLGSLVEFQTEARIRQSGVSLQELEDGGTWNTLAGQATDDSEMALALARQLLCDQGFQLEQVRAAYLAWLKSGPFDIGNTVGHGILGSPNANSQANGSLMRCSPLGLAFTVPQLEHIAVQESSLTHIHPLCCECCRIFSQTISRGVDGATAKEAFQAAMDSASDKVKQLLEASQNAPPADFQHQMGWITIAFTNAYYHLVHETPLAQAVVSTVKKGGDTDTNAAIVGALLGAFQGYKSIPRQWRNSVLTCRPHPRNKASSRPRPVEYWPVDLMVLAEQLLSLKKKSVSSATF
jgi:ADP-ribosylglycohydrolase/fructose-1,6-bisphosphatase/inositol monophosphatase family enzyme